MGTGKNIRTLRELKKISREDMADGLHVSVSGLGSLEREEYKVSKEQLKWASEKLGLTEEYIENFTTEVVFNIDNPKDCNIANNLTINESDSRDLKKELENLLQVTNNILKILKKNNLE